MTRNTALTVGTAALILGVVGYAAIGSPNDASVDPHAVAPAADDSTRGVSLGINEPPDRQDDPNDNNRVDDDDGRPSQDQDRRARGRDDSTGGPRNASQCRRYVDHDDDGVCDNCARTPRGCSAANGGKNPYAGMPVAEDYEQSTTLENLQAAFNGESNARAKYLVFAAKADEEGYAGVASLYRAAAKAEGIHAENHAEVLRQLGASPKAKIATVKVGSTRENLEAAIAGESYEWDVMYPGMLKRARADRNRAALRSFNFAMTVERDHAAFYRAALAGLDDWKSPRDFFVCTVCGETVDKINFKKCPVCFVKADQYITVN